MKNPIVKAILIFAGMLAFALAVVFALRSTDFSAVSKASPLQVLGLAGGVMVNLLLTGVLFWAVTLRFDCTPAVGLRRMVLLILSSSVLNYLPMRAGLLGRAAYLKAMHQLPLRQSALILFIVLGLGALVLGSVGLAVIAVGRDDQMAAILVTGGLLVVLTPVWKMLLSKLAMRPLMPMAVGQWVCIRLTDMFIVGGRTWFAFAITGCPITYAQATALGAAGMLISLVGLTPNGLGLREWALAGMTMLVSNHGASAGATAALVDRAVEVVVVCLLGLPASLHLMRQMAERENQKKCANSAESG